MNRLLREALRYAIASGCALVVDVAILWALVEYCSWWYLAAATASFLSGIVVAYLMSITLVFKRRRLQDRRAEFLTFAVVGAAGLAINATMIFLAVRYLGLYFLTAKGVAAAFTFAFNFLARRQLLFVHAPASSGIPHYGLQRQD
jgi:putative flippase GtrA